MMLKVLCLVITACFHNTDAVCTFPSDLSNSVWMSTEFGDITFETSVAQFVDVGGSSSSNWTCHVSSGSKYVVQSLDTITSNSLGTDVYFYYCFDLYQQSTNSYLYYHPTALNGGKRSLQLGSNTTTVSVACSESIDAAEYHVMVKSDSASSVKNFCVSPLLGNFLYACSSGSSNNGTLNVCDTSSQTTLTFNHSSCTGEVIYSAGGVLNCVAKTSGTVSSETVYYQTLYNADATVNDLSTRRFVCLAVTQDSSGAVTFSYNALACISGQTSTTTTSPVLTFEQLTSTTLCPITETTGSSKSNTALIVGLVVGFLLLAIIVAALIFYFCFYNKDPNAGKPIVENTKPRFEDPDKEDIIEDLELAYTRSTPVTRDEIIFEAMSPTVLANGNIPNGNPVSMSPTGTHAGGFYPNGMANGSLRDSGIAMTEKSSGRPTPRVGINPSKESMVIFNGDEKVISGNDTRIVPNENPNARTFRMNNTMSGDGPLTIEGLDNEEDDELGELSPHGETMPYPSLPREKSNLMPPIETIDPEKDKVAH